MRGDKHGKTNNVNDGKRKDPPNDLRQVQPKKVPKTEEQTVQEAKEAEKRKDAENKEIHHINHQHKPYSIHICADVFVLWEHVVRTHLVDWRNNRPWTRWI